MRYVSITVCFCCLASTNLLHSCLFAIRNVFEDNMLRGEVARKAGFGGGANRLTQPWNWPNLRQFPDSARFVGSRHTCPAPHQPPVLPATLKQSRTSRDCSARCRGTPHETPIIKAISTHFGLQSATSAERFLSRTGAPLLNTDNSVPGSCLLAQ